ncbi:hypothetical protein BDQ17DRAFT_1432978 [Cyathus striatus]|nr:hypothetical protein BDQ17DRAFT_1432978 [Cyathus striatus]
MVTLEAKTYYPKSMPFPREPVQNPNNLKLHIFFKNVERYSAKCRMNDEETIKFVLDLVLDNQPIDYFIWVGQAEVVRSSTKPMYNWQEFKRRIVQLRPEVDGYLSLDQFHNRKDQTSLNSEVVVPKSKARVQFMPSRRDPLAPKFNGNPFHVHRFFEEVEMLADQCGLDDTKKIEWALQYVELPADYDLWSPTNERLSTQLE